MDTVELEREMLNWRHYLHSIPETGFEERQTAEFVAGTLASLGLEVARGIGGTGVVGTLRLGGGPRIIGFRADMDALPLQEVGTHPYSSRHPGCMHACGHDGHMAMLLGAAGLLAQAQDLDGTIHFVFQPAEEHGKGAKAMIADGLLTRFPMDEIYGVHSNPGMPAGHFATRIGGIMASEDNFVIRIHGRAAHAARPHMAVDPIVIGSEIVLALQTILARNVDPTEHAVVSVTEFLTDGARNALPANVVLKGDTRSYNSTVQGLLQERMAAIVNGVCAAHGATADFEYSYEFEPTFNAPLCVATAVQAAIAVAGKANVDDNCAPMLASEDFGAFLVAMPGNYMFIGSGTHDEPGGTPLHSPLFDFNDDLLLPGARYFATIGEQLLRR